MCKHLEPGRRAIVKEFYSERRNPTCYIKGRWIPFGERAISQLFRLREGGYCAEYEKLQKHPDFEEIARELTDGQRQWQRIRTISNTFINKGDLTEVNKVGFYLVNSVLKPSKHVSTMRQDCAILLYALVGLCIECGENC